MKQHTLLIGAHTSIAGGLHRAIERAKSIGCSAVQLFTKNNRQWNAKSLTTEEINLFKESVLKSSIAEDAIFAHATYLINIGSADSQLEKKSLFALIEEVNRCAALGIKTLVLHPGSYTGSTREAAIARIIKNLTFVIRETAPSVTILLETSAGQGKTVGTTFEELGTIIHALETPKKRIGICLDTCHVFAAGYSFDNQETYRAMWYQFDSALGRKLLHLIHVNDSKTLCNSRVDRHHNIGKGNIPLNAFSLLCNDPELKDIPKILETPYTTELDLIPDINLLKSLVNER